MAKGLIRRCSVLRIPTIAVLSMGLLASGAQAGGPPKGSSAQVGQAHAVVAHVDRAADGKGVLVLLNATLDAPVSAVERVVGEVAAWPDWIPRMTAVTALSGDEKLRDFETRVDLPWPLSDVREHLRMKREQTGRGVRFTWSQVTGDLRHNEG